MDLGTIHLVEKHLLEIDEKDLVPVVENVKYPNVFALTRTKLNMEEAPTGKKLEAVKQMMLRVHRASGHSGFSNLQRLLEARGSPRWAIELAGTLTCPECQEASMPKPKPPASLEEEPKMFEVVGTDIFEYEDEEKKKYKGIIWRDRATGLTMLEILHGMEGGGHWEPTSKDIIQSLTRWMMFHPAPMWIVADAATYYTSQELMDFCGRSGIGLTIVPAEAHWLMGSEEQAIGVAKRAVTKMRKEFVQYDVATLFQLAAHAANAHVGGSGYSAYQWVHGKDHFTGDSLPAGMDPTLAFGGLLKARDRIRIAYETEKARDKFSKLSNATTRPAARCTTGQLVMLWRQRVKPGKVRGSWTGPLRVILTEGSTIWLASGSTLVRAKQNQVRPITKREELAATLEGTAVIKTPITVEALLRSFQGRNYLDVTGNVPSARQVQEDLSTTEVAVPSSGAPRTDSWVIREEDDSRWLIRVHRLPRLALFAPTRLTACPVDLDELTGKRQTIVKYAMGGDEVLIDDDVSIQRSLPDRWTGETRLEMKPLERPSKQRRKKDPTGTKRKAEDDLQDEEQPQPQHELPPATPDSNLQQPDSFQPAQSQPTSQPTTTTPEEEIGGRLIPRGDLQEALEDRGPDVVDGISKERITGASGSNTCAIPGCELPGGHSGAHEGPEGRFLYDLYEGKKWLVDGEEKVQEDSDSSSSEELLPDEDRGGEIADEEVPEETFVVCEIELDEKDITWLANNHKERKVNIWLSKKMSEKGKEVVWNQLPLSKKKEFDLAQARELNQVAVSKALRKLTEAEMKNLNWSEVMQMRWVLTLKSDGTPKARLVVLGFQAPNLTEVATAAPTMSRAAINLLLTAAASLQLKVKAGDVSSAFLQTVDSLENEGLTVWAPPELAAFYGGDPREQLPLRVLKAFYGLVHAPRKWFETVEATLKGHGWKQLIADRCLYVLKELDDKGRDQVVGLAGLHVDDFLLAGKEDSELYKNVEKKLLEAFRFGKWELGSDTFEFAGCELTQHEDFSISLSQEKYVNRWVEEIDIDASRSKTAELSPKEISQVRAALGTISWKATQTGPQYLAETSLFLSELGKGSVELMYRVNKLVREMKRSASQRLVYPCWNLPLDRLAVITWCDASNHNRYDKSSTLGVLTGVGPAEALQGEEVQLALVQWKSGKTPRQCLGSNGAEVQAVTVGEDQNYQIRGLLCELKGTEISRERLHQQVAEVPGALVMDSRGIYDASTRNLSSLHGLRDSRSGYELTIAVARAAQSRTQLRWVNGGAQLADSLTKADRKVILQFMAQRQFWRLVHDEKFTSGRKLQKRALEKKMLEDEKNFVSWVRNLAKRHCWPWDEGPEERYHAFT